MEIGLRGDNCFARVVGCLQRSWKFEDCEVNFHMPANSTISRSTMLLVARLDAFVVRKSKRMWALFGHSQSKHLDLRNVWEGCMGTKIWHFFMTRLDSVFEI